MREGLKLYYQVAGLKGVAAGVAGTLLGRHTTMAVRLPDSAAVVHLRMPSTDVTTFRQVILFEEYALDSREPPEVVVDAGANVGLASVYFASRYPSARIVAIEPATENFRLLQQNVAAFPNVRAVQAALWNEDTEIDLLDPGLGASGFVTGAGAVGEHRERVAALTLGSILDRFELDRVDLLKVDIEGAELEVFQQAAAWIDRVDAIAIELHDRIKPGCEQVFRNATKAFDQSWQQGENTFCTRAAARLWRPGGGNEHVG